MWRTPSDDLEDWGDSFDDKDSGYWNEFYSGPDDDEVEDYYEAQRELNENCISQHELEQSYEDETDVEEEDIQPNWAPSFYELVEDSDRDVENQNINNLILARKIEILNWLAGSDIARINADSLGIFVPGGLHVKLKDGEVIEIIEWLIDEEILGGEAYGEYSIVENYSMNNEFKGYNIFKIIDAPFYQRNNPRPWMQNSEQKSTNNQKEPNPWDDDLFSRKLI